MSNEANETLVRRCYAAFNAGSLDEMKARSPAEAHSPLLETRKSPSGGKPIAP